MALSIRFSRQGKRHSPVYRIVVQDKGRHPKKRFVESLGNFYALNQQKPETPQFQCDIDRLKHWVSKGAVCSDRVSHLLRRHGVTLGTTETSQESGE